MKIKAFFLSAMLGILSCNNSQSPTPNPTTNETKNEQIAQQLNKVLAKYEQAPQKFNVSAQKPSSVKGKQGTVIFINPDDLMTTNGEAVSGSIEVELKELTNQKQLLNANATTSSNGKLLVSGGAYYINMSASGKPLKLKSGKTLSVEFPQITTEKMGLFYGQRDGLGNLNWVESNQKFQTQPIKNTAENNEQKATTTEKKTDLEEILDYVEIDSNYAPISQSTRRKWAMESKIYQAIQLNSLGWINCDRFLENTNNTNLLVNFSPADGIKNGNLYLIFRDINSVISSFYNVSATTNETFNNIPIGYKVQLVAYAIKDEKIWLHNSQFNIQANQSITLTMKETNENELAKIFANR